MTLRCIKLSPFLEVGMPIKVNSARVKRLRILKPFPLAVTIHNQRCLTGGALVEVMVAIVFFVTTATFVLDSQIQTRLLWQTLSETSLTQRQMEEQKLSQTLRDDYDQKWEDISAFGQIEALARPTEF